MDHYGEQRLGFAPTFPAFDERRHNSPSRRIPDVAKNYSDAMAYDSHGYIYNTMSGGSTIATEEIEFQYPPREDEDSQTDGGLTEASQTESYNPSTALYPVKKPHHGHKAGLAAQHPGQLLTTNSSMSSRTASTWLNETTYASTSLLDQDDGESWSSASATTSVLLDGEEEEDPQETDTRTKYDDATTYMESPVHQAPIDLVESFLDELAENESVQRLGNFILSSTCRGRYSSDEDEDEDDEEFSFDDGTTTDSPRRGRSPRKKSHSSLRSFQSMTDSIFEVRRRESHQEPHGGTTRKKRKSRKSLKSLFACGI